MSNEIPSKPIGILKNKKSPKKKQQSLSWNEDNLRELENLHHLKISPESINFDQNFQMNNTFSKQSKSLGTFFDNKSIDLKLIREKEEMRRREFLKKRNKYVKRQKKIIYRSNFVLDKIDDENQNENENANGNGTLKTNTTKNNATKTEEELQKNFN
ncbi:protein phosphatase inhibitor [Anaeramoeba flamelloides]|uniref:Protein phosphatase inhibitor n=1 Tax=Anaeramoeba flamelloides TaxID=1746091 RepID=A0AAV7YR72_9EUKA|nr:protein phosphatase inhibitor [Anaeramoeba flamelloides]